MHSKRVKPSGTFFREQKRRREAETKVLSGSLLNFLAQPETSSPVASTANEVSSTATASTETAIASCSPSIDNLNVSETEAQTEEVDVIANGTLEPHDPSTWPSTLSRAMRDFIISAGPPPSKEAFFSYVFPQTNSRSFSIKYFDNKLANGDLLRRTWLTYSKLSDSCFCFCCVLFNRGTSQLGGVGFRDWKHISKSLSQHTQTKHHIMAFNSWKECEAGLATNKTVDAHFQKMLKAETERWKQVFFRIVQCVKFLAKQCIAFRGDTQRLNDPNNGNFLQLIETIATFDPIMSDHLLRHSQCPKAKGIHYLSSDIQNDILSALATCITDAILAQVRQSRYYSIIVDCTPDLSHKEQLSIILRYVHFSKDSSQFEILEKFLTFAEVLDKTGKGISDLVIQLLATAELDVANMRGQGYDNGSNMAGKNIGVQKRISDINPRAFFVPCACHSLNLVLNDAANCSGEVFGFFSIVNELYVFFSGSTNRWAVLQKHATTSKSIHFKRLSDTRWSSRAAATKCLVVNLPQIYDALLEIHDSTADKKVQHQSKCIAEKICCFKFVLSAIIWHNILTEINKVSLYLQSEEMDIAMAISQISVLQTYFAKLRATDSEFNSLISQAENIANEMHMPAAFPAASTFRMRRRSVHFEHEGRDEPIVDPKQKFKVEFFYYLLDIAVNALDERFQQMTALNARFHFLYHLNDADVTLEQCKDLQEALSDGDNSDIDANDIFNEIAVYRSMSSNQSISTPLKILNHLASKGLLEIFPNLVIALRIICTIPVGVASAERSFSKLKLIKSYLRTTMTEGRLNDLAVVAIESDNLPEVEQSEVVSRFASMKARKVSFI